MKAIGITDSVNTCDCCGKTDLKKTVAFDTGVFYGVVCASRNTGKTRKVINEEIKSHESIQLDRANEEYRQTEEYKNLEDFIKNNQDFVGVARLEAVRPLSSAATEKRIEIAEKYGVKPYQMC